MKREKHATRCSKPHVAHATHTAHATRTEVAQKQREKVFAKHPPTNPLRRNSHERDADYMLYRLLRANSLSRAINFATPY